MIVLDDINVHFGGVHALRGISARLGHKVCGLIGPNGAGKTTLLNVLSGFVTPSSGTIRIGGDNILTLSPYQRARWGLRRGFQREQLVEELTVSQNVMVVLDALALSMAEKRQAVLSALDFCGLKAKSDWPGKALNAFERRLVEMARCVVGKPRLIVLDEPGGGLSQAETHVLRDMISRIYEASGAQVLLIDHDVDLIQAVCQSALVLDFGVLIASGETQSVLQNPRVRAAYLGLEDVTA